MNEAGAKALYEATRRGIKQIKGDYHDEDGGACGIGAIHLSLHAWNAQEAYSCPIPAEHPITAGLISDDDMDEIVELNDGDGLTYDEIARKLGPDAA